MARIRHPFIRFIKPDRKKVAVFGALMIGVVAITYILSISGTFQYRNCVLSLSGLQCFPADLVLIGLPNFYTSAYYVGSNFVPPAFDPLMFFANLAVWYLVAAAWSFGYDEALKRAVIPKVKRAIKKID